MQINLNKTFLSFFIWELVQDILIHNTVMKVFVFHVEYDHIKADYIDG